MKSMFSMKNWEAIQYATYYILLFILILEVKIIIFYIYCKYFFYFINFVIFIYQACALVMIVFKRILKYNVEEKAKLSVAIILLSVAAMLFEASLLMFI